MRSIKESVENIIRNDHEALLCLSRGILNLSQYARRIHPQIEKDTFKKVKETSIIMALSRLKNYGSNIHTLRKQIHLDTITLKTPQVQVIFERNKKVRENLLTLDSVLNQKKDEWFIFNQNTNVVSILAGEPYLEKIKKHIKGRTISIQKNLTAISLSLNEKYQEKPNIVFSILYPLAEKEIPVLEVISTYGEIIIISKQRYTYDILKLLKIKTA